MKNLEINFVIGILALIISLIAGYFISKQGAPFGFVGTSIHKFASLGAIVFFAIAIWKYSKATNPGTAMVIIIVLAGIFLISAMVTGGIVTSQNTGEGLLPKLHRICNIGSILSLGTLIYLYYKS